MHSCYEARRNGGWLHGWLVEQGIDNIVVDAPSIKVNRHARPAKTDQIDGDILLSMRLRHNESERVWSVLHDLRHRTKTRGAPAENWHDRRMSAPRTPTALVRCWCCITCYRKSSWIQPVDATH